MVLFGVTVRDPCDMLVQIDSPSSRASAAPSIMDSPTLARVERAMLRHEEGTQREIASLNRSAITQSLLSSNFGKDSGYHAIKRGLLWQQRDRLFSRWKERYFILTRDYLHCFRRATGTDRITEMGQFLFKVKLVDVERVEWINKKTYSTVALELGRDGRVLLRAAEGLEDWFELLEECMLTSKERRRALRVSHEVGKRNNNNSINSSLEEWISARQKIPGPRANASATPSAGSSDGSVQLRPKKWDPSRDDDDTWTLRDSVDNRLSLLTDIDISSYDGTLDGPSVASFRLNDDVFCVSRNHHHQVQQPFQRLTDAEAASLRGSFRSRAPLPASAAQDGGSRKCGYSQDGGQLLIKFRERSHSDIQRIDRRPWRLRAESETRAAYN